MSRWHLSACTAADHGVVNHITCTKCWKTGLEILRLADRIGPQPFGCYRFCRPPIDTIKEFNLVARISRLDSNRDSDVGADQDGLRWGGRIGSSGPQRHAIIVKTHGSPS
jgi:hypothetical protein